ncbi:DUF2846 domain-containing protein [Saccharophagus sp. K07]|jgi:hypothetical protein|uniref:DUF2846 domain-containing protein n=1 Tax=Saccharophagus sp. K07 TaxID=2283636 RepID=UPI001651E7E8|nr:DUF2846 domain-containing protein [Saccharophagus sp. K07]MBC6905465.1 DUF2846 domain-containing protein [Saccharophagus sp. K07]
MKSPKSICLLITSLFITSCATLDGPTYSEIPQTIESGKSRVVVLRAPALKGLAWPSHFYVDGKLFAMLNNHGFAYTDVPPGTHVVSTGPQKNPTFRADTVSMEEGKTYFFRLKRGNPDVFFLILPDEAQKMLNNQNFRYQPLKD